MWTIRFIGKLRESVEALLCWRLSRVRNGKGPDCILPFQNITCISSVC